MRRPLRLRHLRSPQTTLFGYEGSSADKGGYIERGFDDLTWL